MKLARDGFPSLGGMVFMVAGAWFFSRPVAVCLLVPLAFLVWFYRDPDRTPPEDPTAWASPADGKVVEIERVYHPFVGEVTKVGIFMSPLDVHVNRAPTAGTVAHLEYVPGKKWLAFAPKASEENERLYLGLETEQGRTMMVQIAGLLARRIVCRAPQGTPLARGQRYGMIKLGSKVDLYLPNSVSPAVTLGQKVRAGETPIGVVNG